MGKNLRQWLDEMARRYPEELLTTKQEVRPGNYEASSILECLDRQTKYPAVFFENVRDLNGNGSPFRLLMNTFSTSLKIGVALGLEKPTRREIMERYWRGQASGRDVVKVSKKEAPVKEVIWTGNKLDLRDLPIPRINEMDGGPYLTPAIIAKPLG